MYFSYACGSSAGTVTKFAQPSSLTYTVGISGLAACGKVPPAPRMPAKLDGIFVSLNALTAVWSPTQWEADLRSMRDVGMTFFVVAPAG